ncbi:hypothetical protein HK097_006265 [Rhizophlyctis rosea]|uniref:L-ornithine N(5)-monooxygenase [NAD(P)H] n=1 Tax=Rhizophlyctis rosea TaxID=64517 RepID=A0AAD5X2W0_9FUNG|nr:hypothetical protein HK097_006265 [Rhizophlyctis rosea]
MSTDENLDVAVVGMGPAALALAVTLASEGVIPAPANLPTARKVDASGKPLRVRFIEKQTSFSWHGGMLVDDARMRISFVKDLATLRDPTSPFTFLNFSKAMGRLSAFLNLGTFYPYRVEYNEYLQWASKHFDHVASYGERVCEVRPITTPSQPKTVNEVEIISVRTDGTTVTRTAKNVIMAVGGQPAYPTWCISSLLPQTGPNPSPLTIAQAITNSPYVHTADYQYRVTTTLPDPTKPYRIAVIGAGQSAAEVFNDLMKRYPNSQAHLVFRNSALRPADDSPFVNEIFDPPSVNVFYGMTPEGRQRALNRDRGTNYAVVNMDLIENIYGTMYKQLLPAYPFQHDVLHSHDVVGAKINEDGSITLQYKMLAADRTRSVGTLYELTYDAVFLGTGYEHGAHLDILKPMEEYLVKSNVYEGYEIGRDYKVETKEGCGVGVWLQGACQDSHGLSDTLLSVISVRSEEVYQSLTKHMADHQSSEINCSAEIDEVSRLPTPQQESFKSTKQQPQTNGITRKSEPPMSPPQSPTQQPTLIHTPGKHIFSKHIPHLNETLDFHIADPTTHLSHFHTWMNNPRVNAFWKEEGTLAQHTQYLQTQLSTPHSLPVIASFNSTPFAYFEIYWAAQDKISAYYPSLLHDRGIHMLVGNEDYRGPHRVEAWLPSLVELCLKDDERTTRVVSEPREDNGKMIGYLEKYGFRNTGVVQLPHKRAAIMIREGGLDFGSDSDGDSSPSR